MRAQGFVVRRVGLWLVVMLLALALAGCGRWSRDGGEAPAPLPEFTPVAVPQALWTRSIGQAGDRYLWQIQPGVLDDRIVVADAQGRVSALQRASGQRVWDQRLRGVRVSAGVSVGAGVALLGTLEGEVLALNLDDGQELWRTRLTSEVLALSAVGSGGVTVARTNDGRLHAFDGVSGAMLWSMQRETPALSLRGAHQPQMLPGRVLAGFDNGRLLMLGLGRGNVLWEFMVAAPQGRSDLERLVDIDGYIPVQRGVAYASAYQGRLVALALDEGERIWERSFSSYQGGAIDAEADILVVTADDSHLWGLDAGNGGDLWQQNSLRLRGVSAPVAVGNGQIVVGDFQGYLYWISTEDGGFLARLRVASAPIISRPVLHDGVLYVLTGNGRLAAVPAQVLAASDS